MAGSVSFQVFLHRAEETTAVGESKCVGDKANSIVQLAVPVHLDKTKTLLLTELGIISQSIEAADAAHLPNCCLKMGKGSFSSRAP